MSARVYFGSPAHFIGGDDCRFHIATLVNGTYLVSTVGEYKPSGLPDEGYRDIGYNRKYETYVFGCSGVTCDCGCGLAKPDNWSEIDSQGYQTAKEANEGHEAMCAKYEALVAVVGAEVSA